MPKNRFVYSDEEIESLKFEPPKDSKKAAARDRATAIGKKITEKYVNQEKPK